MVRFHFAGASVSTLILIVFLSTCHSKQCRACLSMSQIGVVVLAKASISIYTSIEKNCKRMLTAHPILNLFCMYSYSVLSLRSQLTKPTPMLPRTRAPGAGMTTVRNTSAVVGEEFCG